MVKSVVSSRSKLSYFIEFLIIIAGIMVSFVLNEWRETKRIQEKKTHLLSDINSELKADSLLLEQAIKYYEKITKSHDSLLINRNKEMEIDSIDVYLDHFSSYFPFNETNTSFNKILNDQELTVEKEDTLIQYYVYLHNIIYPSLHEWYFIEKDFVLNIVLPYMDKNAPFIYPTPANKSFSGEVYYELKKKDEFMNYLKSGGLYKKTIKDINSRVLEYVKYVKVKINQNIKKNSKQKKH